VRDLLLANGHRPRRFSLLPYAVDWGLLGRLPPPPPLPPVVVGFAGTLAPHKGVDLLLEAARGLAGDLRVEIHGRFGDNPGYDDWLRSLAAGDPRIRFAGGFERERLPEVLGRLHCLVVPSRWRENTPFVCLEGRAAGLPVVASDLSGMAEAVPFGRGHLFRAGDAGDLRAVLQQVLDEVRARHGARLPPDSSIPAIDAQFADLRQRYVELAGGRQASR
jgi:glycosyltransferase involved in cell wall biosynthesis